ncbi:hypothetical protein P170DRAFT_505648 [Aspergillus steynii IBT 23096]|uniref:Uncharacterized protein n=1 Tax=Aspergillus steynii IBT 23096 TaxID=1392250 RepID=A0A2I2GQ63_9EURO|nr:uncharacterized protein P170DRAFT_505648 [Aspergillus steynii IBT 23096]PLB55016.1 hypothetical protein P170DRAFT_505648 [Aspergillus steynii IBT 23096]
MHSMRLASRLPSVFTAAPRATTTAPWKTLSAGHVPSQIHSQLPSSISPRRQFSQTIPSFSSPFRLSSNNGPAEHSQTSAPSQPEFEINDPNDPLSHYAQYKPKRQWPPDMSKLSPKHQFRLERKYRRRAALKFARPKWMKATKLVQWGVIGFVLIYAMLFMEWDDRGSPFEEFRKTFFAGVKGAFSSPPPPGPVRKSDDTTTKEQ